jgi:hypothetical protein
MSRVDCCVNILDDSLSEAVIGHWLEDQPQPHAQLPETIHGGTFVQHLYRNTLADAHQFGLFLYLD